MPSGIVSLSSCIVNENTHNSSTKRASLEDLKINDLLENIRICLYYIKKQQKTKA